jgi:hypothetical protein
MKKLSEKSWLQEINLYFADGYRAGRDRAIEEYDEKNCVCKGNWRSLMKQYDSMIGKNFVMQNDIYHFFGIVHGADDYYFGMNHELSGMQLFSCVCDLKTYGFVPYEEEKDMREQLSDRITNYLSAGGLFNPELMDHKKVNELLIDIRNFLDESKN